MCGLSITSPLQFLQVLAVTAEQVNLRRQELERGGQRFEPLPAPVGLPYIGG